MTSSVDFEPLGSSTRIFFVAGSDDRLNTSVVVESGPLSSSEEYPSRRADMVATAKQDCLRNKVGG